MMYCSCAKSNILYFVIALSDKIFVYLLADWKGNKSMEWLEENGYESNYSVRFLAFSIFPILDIFLIITFHFDWSSNDISTILPYFFRSLVMCEWNFISIHFQERGKCQGLIPKLKKNYCLHIMNHKFIWDVANKNWVFVKWSNFFRGNTLNLMHHLLVFNDVTCVYLIEQLVVNKHSDMS